MAAGAGLRASASAPRRSFEELEVRTTDGAVLRGAVEEPPDGVPARAVLVLVHAMFARRSSYGRRDRPGLAQALAERGFRTIAFDLRGHGESTTPSGAVDYGYDDFVRHDLPSMVAASRSHAGGAPVLYVGHSLGGHVGLASQGTGRLQADAMVLFGANVWLEAAEPSALRWGAKRAVTHAVRAVVAGAGRFPARRLRIGSDDAAAPYLEDLFRGVKTGRWTSTDGRDDYWASLEAIRVPVAAVVGARDLLLCSPSAGRIFARRCAGAVRTFTAPGGHMDLVTSAASRPFAIEAVEWAVARALLGAGVRSNQDRP